MKKQAAASGYSSSALGGTLFILGKRFKFKSECAFNKFKIQTIPNAQRTLMVIHPYHVYAHFDGDQWMGYRDGISMYGHIQSAGDTRTIHHAGVSATARELCLCICVFVSLSVSPPMCVYPLSPHSSFTI